LNKIASGERTAASLDSVLFTEDSSYPSNALRLYFTSNHDENSWNKADYGTMPGPIHAPFAVFTQTYSRSLPLIYSGQEEPVTDSISFFYKDTISFKHTSRASFYKTLLNLRKDHPALRATVPAKRMKLGDPAALFSFSREADGKKLIIVLNFSSSEQPAVAEGIGNGRIAINALDKNDSVKDGGNITLPAWGYKIYMID
jgi:hypothetical protein